MSTTDEQRIEPGPGQESVWDYPQPPRMEPCARHIQVVFNGETIADTRRAVRVLETGHPPVYYIPLDDVRRDCLLPSSGGSVCEWKGAAVYFSVTAGDRRADGAAWAYPYAPQQFADLRDRIAFYAAPMDACTVDGERVTPQPGSFYGGWITQDIVGPFKGRPAKFDW